MTQDRCKRCHQLDEITSQASIYRLMVENTVDVIVRGDADRNQTYVSPSSREMLGYEPSELLGGHALELVHPDEMENVSKTFRKVGPDHPRLELLFRMRRKNGSFIWVEARYRHLPEDGGLIAVLRDVTARHQAEMLLTEANGKLEAANLILNRLAQQDGLTGLANRRHFDEALEEEFRRAARQELPLGLVLLDADNFKSYNDCYGHTAGDDCLRGISRAVESVLRRPGELAARYGGEEFAVLLPATDADGAMLMAERMRAAVVAAGIEHQGNSFGVVTVSAGATSTIPVSGGDPGSLVSAADLGLYRAKADGRNAVRRSSIQERLPAL